MPKPKQHHYCLATHPNGQRCKLESGPQHHQMLRNDRSGLGLPVPVHELEDGTTWHSGSPTLDLGDVASGALTRRPT